jgi:hypothetical protein
MQGLLLKTTSIGQELWRLTIEEGAGSELIDVLQTDDDNYIISMVGGNYVYLKCYGVPPE